MAEPTLSNYTSETDPRRKGDIFEKLVISFLPKRYKGVIVSERNLGSGTVFDGLTTQDGRPLVIEIKHKSRIVSLSDGNTSGQLPRQVEMAISNHGLYEIVVAAHTDIGDVLCQQLIALEKSKLLRWRICDFHPAEGTFRVRCSSKGDS